MTHGFSPTDSVDSPESVGYVNSAPAGLATAPPVSPEEIKTNHPKTSIYGDLPTGSPLLGPTIIPRFDPSELDEPPVTISGQRISPKELIENLGEIPLPNDIHTKSPLSSPSTHFSSGASSDSWSDLGSTKREPSNSNTSSISSFSRVPSGTHSGSDSGSESEIKSGPVSSSSESSPESNSKSRQSQTYRIPGAPNNSKSQISRSGTQDRPTNPYLAVVTPRHKVRRTPRHVLTTPGSPINNERSRRMSITSHSSDYTSPSNRVLDVPVNVLPVVTPADRTHKDRKSDRRVRTPRHPPKPTTPQTVQEPASTNGDLMTFDSPISSASISFDGFNNRNTGRRSTTPKEIQNWAYTPSELKLGNRPTRRIRRRSPSPSLSRHNVSTPKREMAETPGRVPHGTHSSPSSGYPPSVTTPRSGGYSPDSQRMGYTSRSRYSSRDIHIPTRNVYTPNGNRSDDEDSQLDEDQTDDENARLDEEDVPSSMMGYTWQQIVDPTFDFELLTNEDNYRLYEEAWARYKVLDSTYGSTYPVPKFPEGADLQLVVSVYTDAVNRIHSLQNLGRYRVYLMICVAAIEVISVKVMGMEIMKGYTEHQRRTIRQYDMTLIELGEVINLSVGKGWPPWVWLLITSVVNIVTFIVVRLIVSYLGDGAAGLISMINTFMNFGASNTDEKQPDPYGGSSSFLGFDIPNIVSTAASTISGVNAKSSNTSTGEEKPKQNRGPRRPPFQP